MAYLRRSAPWLATALLVACGGGTQAAGGGQTTARMSVAENTNAPPPDRYEPPPAAEPTTPPTTPPTAAGARAGSGTSRDDPVMACGPSDSYAYVAGEFTCPDGTNPLGGDPSAGRDARVGNVGANASGHIIDLYRVPCAGGPVDVFVDMYGCEEMEGSLGGI